jgi:hypothetical protein
MIWGSHGSEYEDGCLLGCNTMQSGRSLPAFQRSLLPPSSGRWQGDRPDDGGSNYLRNDGKFLLHNTVLQPRRQPSTWESVVNLTKFIQEFNWTLFQSSVLWRRTEDVYVVLHTFWTTYLYRSVSRFGHLIPREWGFGIHKVGDGWVSDPVLIQRLRREKYLPRREWNPIHTA